MGDWGIPISILLFYGALFILINIWFDEILNIKFYVQLYLTITCVAILWCFYLGQKSYTVWYSFSEDEVGETRYIEFPVIWM
jgi:hypothetical protein